MLSDIVIPMNGLVSGLAWAMWGSALAALMAALNSSVRRWAADKLVRLAASIRAFATAPTRLINEVIPLQAETHREVCRISEEQSRTSGINTSLYEISPELGFICCAKTLENQVVTDLYRANVGVNDGEALSGASWRLIIHPEQREHYEKYIIAQRGGDFESWDCQKPPTIRYSGLKMVTLAGDPAGTFNLTMRPIPYKNGRRKFIYRGTLKPADEATVRRIRTLCDKLDIPHITSSSNMINLSKLPPA